MQFEQIQDEVETLLFYIRMLELYGCDIYRKGNNLVVLYKNKYVKEICDDDETRITALSGVLTDLVEQNIIQVQ